MQEAILEAGRRMTPFHVWRGVNLIAMLCLAVGIHHTSNAQQQTALCSNGDGNYQAEFQSTGVSVRIGASHDGELANRRCEANLSWRGGALPVATDAAQVDLDAFGADLGFGAPVAAFQILRSDHDCCVEYRIYSLNKPPHLLRTLAGGSSFSAADTDLDSQIEIWTDDAASVAGFDGLSAAELDSPPRIILRFTRGHLQDASAEFQGDFDRVIKRLESEINPGDLSGFKLTDGKLSNTHLPPERLHDLRLGKAKVLEIVWSYLYSGREPQAWNALTEMWPAADRSRIQTAIIGARGHGMQTKLDEPPLTHRGRHRHAQIFDATGEKLDFLAPQPILLTRSSGGADTQPAGREESLLTLVIDAAGKVRSAQGADPELIAATAKWKFVPALINGHAVASRMRLSVSLRQ